MDRPPKIKHLNGVRLIAATDPDSCGIWMSVNEYGITCCLLNNYDAVPPKSATPYASRGMLVFALLEHKSQKRVFVALEQMPLNRFRPFTFVVFAPSHPVAARTWDGRQLTDLHGNLPFPFSSAAVASEQVARLRRDALPAHIDEKTLMHYHSSHMPDHPHASVCAHRSHSQTVSLSRVRVTTHEIEYFYTDGAPCRATDIISVLLHRTVGEASNFSQETLSELAKIETRPSHFRRLLDE